MTPKAVLLVHNRQAQLVEFDILLQQSVRADGHVNQPFGQQLFQLRFLAPAE